MASIGCSVCGEHRHFRRFGSKRARHFNGIVENVDHGVRVWRHVDGAIGNMQHTVIPGHGHMKDVRQAPAGSQAGFPCNNCTHQSVRMNMALHEHGSRAVAGFCDSFRSTFRFVIGVDHLKLRDIPRMFACQLFNPGRVADQDRFDHTGFGGILCAFQGNVGVGARHGGSHRCQAARFFQKVFGNFKRLSAQHSCFLI